MILSAHFEKKKLIKYEANVMIWLVQMCNPTHSKRYPFAKILLKTVNDTLVSWLILLFVSFHLANNKLGEGFVFVKIQFMWSIQFQISSWIQIYSYNNNNNYYYLPRINYHNNEYNVDVQFIHIVYECSLWHWTQWQEKPDLLLYIKGQNEWQRLR